MKASLVYYFSLYCVGTRWTLMTFKNTNTKTAFTLSTFNYIYPEQTSPQHLLAFFKVKKYKNGSISRVA